MVHNRHRITIGLLCGMALLLLCVSGVMAADPSVTITVSTYIAPTPAPANFTITQISPTSINITWTLGLNATGTEIRISDDGYPATVTDGYLAYNGTGTYVVIEGLTLSSMTYYFRAWSYNGAGYSAEYAQAQIGGETMIFILFGILGLGFTFGFFWKRSGFFAYGASGIWALLGFLALQHSAGTNPTQIVDVYMGLFWLSLGFTIACGLLPSLMREKPTAEDPCPMDALGDDISSYVALRDKASK